MAMRIGGPVRERIYRGKLLAGRRLVLIREGEKRIGWEFDRSGMGVPVDGAGGKVARARKSSIHCGCGWRASVSPTALHRTPQERGRSMDPCICMHRRLNFPFLCFRLLYRNVLVYVHARVYGEQPAGGRDEQTLVQFSCVISSRSFEYYFHESMRPRQKTKIIVTGAVVYLPPSSTTCSV
jgi:hypothetical protein